MKRVVGVALGVFLSLASGLTVARAQSPGTQTAAAVWVASQGTASLRVGKALVQEQVQRASAWLVPYEKDSRFTHRGTSIRHLPHKNLIAIQSEASVSVAFVSDKTVSVTVLLRPEIHEDSLRLVLVSTRRAISGCALEGPVCFMVRRAIDRHLGDGSRLQAFLDAGLNNALKPVFRSAAEVACGERQVRPKRVTTAPEFLEVMMQASAADLNCLRRSQPTLPMEDLSAAFKREDKAHKARAHRTTL